MLFDSFSVNASGLDRHGFEKICPAIVQQIESKACSEEESDSKEEVQQGNEKSKGGYRCKDLEFTNLANKVVKQKY